MTKNQIIFVVAVYAVIIFGGYVLFREPAAPTTNSVVMPTAPAPSAQEVVTTKEQTIAPAIPIPAPTPTTVVPTPIPVPAWRTHGDQ